MEEVEQVPALAVWDGSKKQYLCDWHWNFSQRCANIIY